MASIPSCPLSILKNDNCIRLWSPKNQQVSDSCRNHDPNPHNQLKLTQDCKISSITLIQRNSLWNSFLRQDSKSIPSILIANHRRNLKNFASINLTKAWSWNANRKSTSELTPPSSFSKKLKTRKKNCKESSFCSSTRSLILKTSVQLCAVDFIS